MRVVWFLQAHELYGNAFDNNLSSELNNYLS